MGGVESCNIDIYSRQYPLSLATTDIPFWLMCEVLGTLGNIDVQFSSVASAFAAAFLDERSAGFFRSVFASDLGVTCLTPSGIVGEPLFGGTGGFEEECRR